MSKEIENTKNSEINNDGTRNNKSKKMIGTQIKQRQKD